MASERQIDANRRNAHKSAGPSTAGGKKRAGRNAYRHGLAVPILSSQNAAQMIDQLARRILSDSECPDTPIAIAHARSAAEASLDLARVRQAKAAFIECVAAAGRLDPAPAVDPAELAWQALGGPRLSRITLKDGLRRPALLKPSNPPPAPLPQQEPERHAEALRRVLPDLMKFDRYERRAVSRRVRAIIKINNLRLK